MVSSSQLCCAAYKFKMEIRSPLKFYVLIKQALLLVISLSLIEYSCPYNVDVDHPLIIRNLAYGPESYFGATVELFKGRSSSDSAWVLVGAPRANSTHVNYTSAFEPGVIWRCSIGRKPEVCEPVTMDPHGEGLFETAVADRKNQSWVGGVMSDASSDRFVTCGSRWVNNPLWWRNPQDPEKTDYLLHGICYWRPTDSIIGDSIGALPSNYRLLPLKPIPSIPETLLKQAGFYWTFGQVGFSAHVAPDKSLILGAPGISSWKGSVIRYSDSTGPLRILPDGRRDPLSNTFAQNFVARPELEKWLKNDTYFGYSVSAGRFYTESAVDSAVQFVAGAPRGENMAGEVVVFNFPESESEPLKRLQVLTGRQDHSYFGSVISVVDLNGDGLDDLIVGAPRYSSPFRRPKPAIFNTATEPLPGDAPVESAGRVVAGVNDNNVALPQLGVKLPISFSSGDEGAAYVYISTGSSLEFKETLNGDNQPWSQFGAAIAPAGDLNQDGFNDVIIGAPYQDSGRGCVYIYHGSATGTRKEYTQKVCALDVDSELRGFGYSVSRALDVDDNGYDDIAVGSYASASAVIFRSRPSLVVTGQIKTSVSKLPLNSDGFKLTSCIKYTGVKVPQKLVIGVRVLMDTDVRPPRVLVKQPELDGSTYKDLVYEELASDSVETCTELEAVVVTKNFGANIPIKIRQQVFLMDKDQAKSSRGKRSAVHSTKYDIRRQGGRTVLEITGKGLDEFCAICPVLSKPDHDTTTLNLPLEVRCGDDEKCTADLRIQAEFENIKPGDNFTIGSAPTLTLLIFVKNFQETAMSPAVVVSYGRRNLARIPPTCKIIPLDTSHENAIECSLGRPLERDQIADLALVFDMSDLVAGRQAFEKEYLFHIEAKTTSEMVAPATLNLLLPVNATADVELTGRRNEILFSTTTLMRYQIMSHSYDVRLHGPSPIADMWLRFKVPVNLTQGGATDEIIQVLYPKADVDGIDVFCLAVNGYFLQSSSETSVSSRRRPSSVPLEYQQTDPNFDAIMIQPSTSAKTGSIRDLKKRDTSAVTQTTSGKHALLVRDTILFDCDTKNVDCMEIRCKFTDFKPKSRGRVNINMRISSNTTRKFFAEEDAQVLVIQTRGDINLMNVDENIQLDNNYPDKAEGTTTIRLDKPKPIKKRYIFFAVIAGLLLLCIIGYSLYACGCLQRKEKVEDDPSEEQIPLKGPNGAPVSPPPGETLDTITEEHEDSDSGPPSFIPS